MFTLRNRCSPVLFHLYNSGNTFAMKSVSTALVYKALPTKKIHSRSGSRAPHSSPALESAHRNFSDRHCWNCQKAILTGDYFCSCGKIQPVPSDATYFDLLGYPETTACLDTTELSNRMRAAQRQLHPDKFSRVSSHEQSLAADASSAVNKAYSVLANPVDRFDYILRLNYPERNEHQVDDPEFLFEIMELNEELEQLLRSLSTANFPPSDVPVTCREDVIRLFRQVSERADEEKNCTASFLTNRQWSEAQLHLSRYRYFLRVLEQLHENDTAWKIVQSSLTQDK